jgi:hypothetical protein
VTKILALHEEVNGEDDDDADDSDGAEEAHKEFGGGLELGAIGIDDADGLDFAWAGLRRGCGGGAGEVAADVLDSGDGVGEGFFGGEVDGGYLVLDVEAVGGEVASYVEKLTGDGVSDAADDCEGQDADNSHGNDAREMSGFKAADGGSEEEGEGESEGEGNDEIAGEVEDENDGRDYEEGPYP